MEGIDLKREGGDRAVLKDNFPDLIEPMILQTRSLFRSTIIMQEYDIYHLKIAAFGGL